MEKSSGLLFVVRPWVDFCAHQRIGQIGWLFQYSQDPTRWLATIDSKYLSAGFEDLGPLFEEPVERDDD